MVETHLYDVLMVRNGAGAPQPMAVGAFYAKEDTNYLNPLTWYNDAEVPYDTTTVIADPWALVQPFRLEVLNAVFKSGNLPGIPVASVDGMMKAVMQARDDAEAAAGLVGAPAGDAVKAAIGQGGAAYPSMVDAIAHVSVVTFGAKGDGVTDDKAAIDAALGAVSAGGVVVFPGGKNYVSSGGHTIPAGVVIEATGATITHTGNNRLFDFKPVSFNMSKPLGITGANIVGNVGTAATALAPGNTWGFHARNITISGYTAGVGILVENASNWCEGMILDGVMMEHNKVGIRFRVTTGTNSFAYTRMENVSINIDANCIGVDLGGESPSAAYLYNSVINADFWLKGNNAIGLRVGATTNIDNTRFNVTGEVFGSLTGHLGLQNLGGGIKGYGHVNVKAAPNDVTLGGTLILAASSKSVSSSKSAGGDTYNAAYMANVDNPQDATIGYITGSGKSIPFVSGYEGNDAFQVYKTPSGGSPATAGTNVFRVLSDGSIMFGAETNKVRIYQGTGAPSTSTPGYGAVYVRTDDAGGLPQLYVKTTPAGTAGWATIDTRKSGATSARPVLGSGQQRGFPYYDTTLNKPVWWNGTAWTDAAGTVV